MHEGLHVPAVIFFLFQDTDWCTFGHENARVRSHTKSSVEGNHPAKLGTPPSPRSNVVCTCSLGPINGIPHAMSAAPEPTRCICRHLRPDIRSFTPTKECLLKLGPRSCEELAPALLGKHLEETPTQCASNLKTILIARIETRSLSVPHKNNLQMTTTSSMYPKPH